jgi:hypothetical protein
MARRDIYIDLVIIPFLHGHFLAASSFIVAFITATLRVFLACFESDLATAPSVVLALWFCSIRQSALSINAVVTTTLVVFLADFQSPLANTALLGPVLGLGFALSSR